VAFDRYVLHTAAITPDYIDRRGLLASSRETSATSVSYIVVSTFPTAFTNGFASLRRESIGSNEAQRHVSSRMLLFSGRRRRRAGPLREGERWPAGQGQDVVGHRTGVLDAVC
jgi:hypothetical protein